MFPSAAWPTSPGRGLKAAGTSDGLALHLTMSLKCRAQSWPLCRRPAECFFLSCGFLCNDFTILMQAASNPFWENCTTNKIQTANSIGHLRLWLVTEASAGTRGFVPETHVQTTGQGGSSLDGCRWLTEAQERGHCSRQAPRPRTHQSRRSESLWSSGSVAKGM